MKHFLLSLPLGAMWMHCYLMSNDRRAVEGASNRMIKIAEDNGADALVPMFAVTDLDHDGVKSVRKLVRELAPDGGKTLARATDFHMTVWAMSDTDPRCKSLLKMH
jgi:hypothetical protein